MVIPLIKTLPGKSYPMGATKQLDGYNFAIYAPGAASVSIHFSCPNTEEEQATVELKNRTGKVFHGLLNGIPDSWRYAIVTQSKRANSKPQMVLDPYAKSFNRSLVWNRELYKEKSPFFIPKANLSLPTFDWKGVSKPNHAPEDTILYELHVKGFTKSLESVPEKLRGTYLGLAHPAAIHHIKQLGVSSIQIMPVFCFMSEPRLEELGLTNYWGYNPVNFFAPDPRYASGEDAVTEFKTMVRTLHENGIEVILDVVFNHTAEAGKDGPVLSFKGLCPHEFYLKDDNGYVEEYANYTGCGNTVNTDSDFGLKIILDSLRYWLVEMQVDGFRFDLAATLGRNGARFNSNATLFRAIKQDPVISKAKLIAEPWDIGPEGYQLGNFPSNWFECNDKYRDGLRRFWRGDRGLVADTATRILGSRDVFKKGLRSTSTSINYVTYHDGFTLADLVSYEERHNEANLENNRDGHGANFSRNYGVEGTTSKTDIIDLREKMKRNFMATLLFSQGIPHILAGDEIGRTQRGNNNAYCQDNSLSWLNWHLDSHQHNFLAFTQYCIQLRKKYSVLRKAVLADDGYEHSETHHHISWVRPDGEEKSIDDWHNIDNQCIGLLIVDEDRHYKMLIILNASEDVHEYVLPVGSKTYLLVDTSAIEQTGEQEWHEALFPQQAQSLSVWKILD
jgi:glycogen operon protein